MTVATRVVPRPVHAGWLVLALAAPVALALLADPLVAHPRWAAAALGACVALGLTVFALRRHGAFTVWIVVLAGSVLLGELGAVSFGGQNGRLLWADFVIALGVGVALLEGRFALAVPRAPFLVPLGAFVAWATLSLLAAGDLLTGIAELKEWFAMLAVAGFAVAYARDAVRARRLLGAVAITGACVAAHMAVVAWTAPLGPVLAVLMKQVDLPWGRTNYLAGILILALPLALGLMGHARALPLRLVWVVVALANAAGLALSASKGAILALALALLVAYLQGGRATRVAATVVLAIAGAGVAVFEFTPLHQVLAYRMQATAIDYSASERMDLYRLAFEQFLRHPLLGVGINNFSVLANRLRGVDTVPHNLELGFLAELGLPGLLLACWWLARIGRSAWAARQAADPRERALGVALWAAFLAALLHNHVESTIYGQQYKMLLALTAAAMARLGTPAPCSVQRPAEP